MHVVVRDWHDRRSSSPRRSIRARYDAAQTTEQNRRHWLAADSLGVNRGLSREVRQRLRDRSRYEVANNCYAAGLVTTIANDLIGTGPRLQLLTDDPALNRRIEAEWNRWARAARLAEKLRTMREARISDGEAFALLVTNPGIRSEILLDLRLVEADQVTTPDLSGLEPEAIDGIERDGNGNAIVYHVLDSHPGEGRGLAGLAYSRIPARNVLHWFRVRRAGQARGIPELTPALGLFAQLRRYTVAVLAAAEIAAEIAGVLYTDSPAIEPDAAEPFEAIDLEAGSLLTMPNGWKVNQLKGEQPTTTYGEFKREILNEIARCVLAPYNVAAGNSSGYNYSSGRLDFQSYDKALRVDRHSLACVVLDPLLEEWLLEASLIPGLVPSDLRIQGIPHRWFWDGLEHVDPTKEAQASVIRIEANLSTLADECARDGSDWETVLAQRAAEVARIRELGLETASSSSGNTPADPAPVNDQANDQANDQGGGDGAAE
jgi:Bacteriophage capsid protein